MRGSKSAGIKRTSRVRLGSRLVFGGRGGSLSNLAVGVHDGVSFAEGDGFALFSLGDWYLLHDGVSPSEILGLIANMEIKC